MISLKAFFLLKVIHLSIARLASDSLADLVEFQTFELEGEIEDMMWCG
jgi:hypothetical protein